MKTSRFQFEYRASASKLHRAVGDLLRSMSLFEHYEIYQEYPVNRVNENYSDSSHHFDWVIPKLFLVLECHGKQHYVATAFDGDLENASANFKALKQRDADKKEAALLAGFTYVTVPYHLEKKLTETLLLELIDQAKSEYVVWENNNKELLELQAQENNLKEEAELESQKQKEVEQYKIRQQEAKEKYLESEKHRNNLIRAREFRKSQYRLLKGKRNANR
jgi:hypothetical protein